MGFIVGRGKGTSDGTGSRRGCIKSVTGPLYRLFDRVAIGESVVQAID